MARIGVWIMISTLLLLNMGNKAYAVKMQNLYQFDTVIPSQSQSAEEKAERQGLLEVLQRLSPAQSLENIPRIEESLKKAHDYVSEFSFSEAPNLSSSYIIHILYEEEALKNLLKEAGIPFWGKTRPLILVWLVVNSHQETPFILDNSARLPLALTVKESAQRLGMPLILPVMDLEESAAITTEDILKFDVNKLNEKSQRYAPNALLIGNLQAESNHCQSRVRFIQNNHESNYDLTKTSCDEAIKAILKSISAKLASDYIEQKPQESLLVIHLSVNKINNRQDLNQLIQFLKQLPSVKEVNLIKVMSDQVEMTVETMSTLQNFQQNISIARHLMLNREAEGEKLSYEWVP